MIKCKSEKEKMLCSLTNRKHTLYSEATLDKGGKYNGFRPHELLEAAYATCLNISVRMRADKLGITVKEVFVEVEIDRNNPEEAVFKYILEIEAEISDKDGAKLMETANLCAVHNTLSRNIKFQKI